MHWLAIGGALRYGALAASAAHADAVDDVPCGDTRGQAGSGGDGSHGCRRGSGLTLLGLVAQPTGLVGSGGARGAVEVGQLAVLPAADAEQEAHHIGLLLAP